MLTGKVMDKLTKCSWYFHNHIRRVISFCFDHFHVKFGLIGWKNQQSGNIYSDQFVFKRVASSYFLPTSCYLVGLPRELYAQRDNKYNLHVHKHNYFIFFQDSKILWRKTGWKTWCIGHRCLFRHCRCDWLNHSTWSTVYAYYVTLTLED